MGTVAAVLFSGAAYAHHSFSMFDSSKLLKVDGTVKEFEYTNPHAWVHLVAVGANGKPVEWAFEMGSVGQLNRDGWTKNTVKPGDKVTVEFRPLKDGSHGGQFRAVIFADGHRMCQAGAGHKACTN